MKPAAPSLLGTLGKQSSLRGGSKPQTSREQSIVSSMLPGHAASEGPRRGDTGQAGGPGAGTCPRTCRKVAEPGGHEQEDR